MGGGGWGRHGMGRGEGSCVDNGAAAGRCVLAIKWKAKEGTGFIGVGGGRAGRDGSAGRRSSGVAPVPLAAAHRVVCRVRCD